MAAVPSPSPRRTRGQTEAVLPHPVLPVLVAVALGILLGHFYPHSAPT